MIIAACPRNKCSISLYIFFFITSQYQTTLVSPITQLSTRKFANVNTCLHGIFSNTEGKAPSSIIHKVTDTQHRPVSTVPILSPRKQSQSCPLVLTVMDGCGNLFTVVLLGNPIKINTVIYMLIPLVLIVCYCMLGHRLGVAQDPIYHPFLAVLFR